MIGESLNPRRSSPGVAEAETDVFGRQLQTRQRRRRWLFGGVLVVTVVPLAMLAGLMSTPGGREAVRENVRIISMVTDVYLDPETYLFQGRSRINIVFIGRDEDRDNKKRVLDTHGRSDTLIVVSLVKGSKSVHMLSIPRDTLARVPGHGSGKINGAHSLGGPQLVLDTLSDNFGIRVPYFVQLKYDGFKKAVEEVGGVDVFVAKDMDYDDSWGDLHIHLKQGFQHLDGEQAHGFARFRHDKLGDIGRIQRQQTLMRALAKRVLAPSNVMQLHRKVPALLHCVNTNLGESQLMALAFFMREVTQADITAAMLPGTPHGSNWVVNRVEGIELLSTLFGDTFDMVRFEERAITSAPGRAKTATTTAPVATPDVGDETMAPDPMNTEPPSDTESLPPPAQATPPPPPEGTGTTPPPADAAKQNS